MKKTLVFIYAFKITQPEGAEQETKDLSFCFDIMSLGLEDLHKAIKLKKEVIEEKIIPFFDENEGDMLQSASEKDIAGIKELFYFFLKRNEKMFQHKSFIEVRKIILL
jgi:hypothetical protein